MAPPRGHMFNIARPLGLHNVQSQSVRFITLEPQDVFLTHFVYKGISTMLSMRTHLFLIDIGLLCNCPALLWSVSENPHNSSTLWDI